MTTRTSSSLCYEGSEGCQQEGDGTNSQSEDDASTSPFEGDNDHAKPENDGDLIHHRVNCCIFLSRCNAKTTRDEPANAPKMTIALRRSSSLSTRGPRIAVRRVPTHTSVRRREPHDDATGLAIIDADYFTGMSSVKSEELPADLPSLSNLEGDYFMGVSSVKNDGVNNEGVKNEDSSADVRAFRNDEHESTGDDESHVAATDASANEIGSTVITSELIDTMVTNESANTVWRDEKNAALASLQRQFDLLSAILTRADVMT